MLSFNIKPAQNFAIYKALSLRSFYVDNINKKFLLK